MCIQPLKYRSLKMKCSICKEKIQPMYHKGKYVYDGSCNAEPVNKGRCCSICDNTVVMPLRIQPAVVSYTNE